MIMGACGSSGSLKPAFVGLRLAQRLLEKEALIGPSGESEAIDEMVLFDMQAPSALPPALDGKVTIMLGEIANRYRVSLYSLRRANDLRSDTIRVGSELLIPTT